MGVKGGNGVAILARNHRWFLIANYACARVGARTILLNTEFSGPQIADVAEREGAEAADLRRRVRGRGVAGRTSSWASCGRWADPPSSSAAAPVTSPGRRDAGRGDRARQQGARAQAVEARLADHPHQRHHRNPKGANRSAPPTLAPIGGVLSHVPFKSGEVTSLPAPMFHALGYLHATIAMALGSTLRPAPEIPAAHRGGRHRKAPRDSTCRGAGDVVADPRRARQR